MDERLVPLKSLMRVVRQHSMTMDQVKKKKLILLFYKEYEADKFIVGDRFLKRFIRPVYNKLHSRQKITGFAVSFRLLCEALKRAGFEVQINNYKLAAENPAYPVGIVGFPVILDDWRLPNPALLGPSLYDHPGLAPNLFADDRFKKYLCLADWMYNIFHDFYGERCVKWFAGIDTDEWRPSSSMKKKYDFLIYDKIRWNHEHLKHTLIGPICQTLKSRNLSYETITYQKHDHATYRRTLEECRHMIFLCEHETQGLAYQEALASGVSIFAWDNGFWLDPLWQRFGTVPPRASSVPFFSDICGMTFSSSDEFEPKLDKFIDNQQSYNPRRFVLENLSFEASAKLYAKAYFSLVENELHDL